MPRYEKRPDGSLLIVDARRHETVPQTITGVERLRLLLGLAAARVPYALLLLLRPLAMVSVILSCALTGLSTVLCLLLAALLLVMACLIGCADFILDGEDIMGRETQLWVSTAFLALSCLWRFAGESSQIPLPVARDDYLFVITMLMAASSVAPIVVCTRCRYVSMCGTGSLIPLFDILRLIITLGSAWSSYRLLRFALGTASSTGEPQAIVAATLVSATLLLQLNAMLADARRLRRSPAPTAWR